MTMNSGLMRGTLLGIWDTSLAESRMYIIGSHSSPADVGDTIHSAAMLCTRFKSHRRLPTLHTLSQLYPSFATLLRSPGPFPGRNPPSRALPAPSLPPNPFPVVLLVDRRQCRRSWPILTNGNEDQCQDYLNQVLI